MTEQHAKSSRIINIIIKNKIIKSDDGRSLKGKFSTRRMFYTRSTVGRRGGCKLRHQTLYFRTVTDVAPKRLGLAL